MHNTVSSQNIIEILTIKISNIIIINFTIIVIIMISSMHVLFMREHNRVAKLIGKYLPKNLQQDELIYQVR